MNLIKIFFLKQFKGYDLFVDSWSDVYFLQNKFLPVTFALYFVEFAERSFAEQRADAEFLDFHITFTPLLK